MSPRRYPPDSIWGIPMTWTEAECEKYIAETESNQDKMEVNKLLTVRETFTHYLYDEIYQRQVLVNNESKTITTKSLTAIVKNGNKLFPGLGNLSSRIYLAPRHKNLLIMCIEDFQKEMRLMMNYSIFDGRDWKIPTALPNNPVFNTTNHSPSNPDISKSCENLTPAQIISQQ